METRRSPDPDPAAAQAALNDVASARGRVADRVSTPWWYRVSWGLTLGLVFIAFGYADRTVDNTVGIIAAGFSGIAVLCGLAALLARCTGVSLDRYSAGRPGAIYLAGTLVLFAAGLVVRAVTGQWWVMILVAVGVLLWTLLMEPRVDAAARRGLREAR